jgi:hypothetical protein
MPNVFERALREQYKNPKSQWLVIWCGVVFLCVGFFTWLHKRDLSQGLSWMIVGSGMALYGVSLIYLRPSKWRWIPLLIALSAWFVGTWEIIRMSLWK